MNQNTVKHVPVRLQEPECSELRERVMRRDSWRCHCGSMTNLEVHHQQFRGRSGPDHEDNLITLCHRCHSAEHFRQEQFN